MAAKKEPLREKGTIWVYNNDPFHKTACEAKAGDQIEWKKEGAYGRLISTIIGFMDSKPNHVLIQTQGDHPRWIKISNIYKVIIQ